MVVGARQNFQFFRQRNCSLVYNIMELYNFLIQTRLTTGKTKRDI